MTAAAFDTLRTAKRLKEAGLPEAQAEAVTDAIRSGMDTSDFATKADIQALKTELKTDIESLRLSTKADLRELELRLETRIEAAKNDLLKWFIGMAFAQSALIVTLLKLFPVR